MNNIQQSNSADFMLDSNKLESAYRLANAFHKAGCFNATVKNAEQALVVIMAGREAGLEPVESMNSFYFVNNRLNMYGSGLAKAISKSGVKIKFHTLNKETIKVEYTQDGETLHKAEYSISDLPSGKAKGFAPEEKLVYHAHSRFLRYHNIGVSVPYTDYDQDIMDGNQSKGSADKENEEIKKRLLGLVGVSQNIEDLQSLAKPIEELGDKEVINAYHKKVSEYAQQYKLETQETVIDT